MFRGLVLTILVMLTPHTGAAQPRGMLHITVTIVDSSQRVTPVPRHALLISDTPPSAPPRRIRTSLEGRVDVRLAPGAYTVESDRPVALDGKAYQWTIAVDVVDGRDTALELNAANAEVVPVTDEATSAAASLEADPSSLLARWQDSLVAIWTATAHGSGFLVDGDGLVAADQQVIGDAAFVEVQLSPSLKVAGTVVASDGTRGIALIRINSSVAASAKALPVECGTPAEPLGIDQEIVALEAPLGRLRDIRTGSIEVILANVIDTDLQSSPGGSGGPAFATTGQLIGLTTLVPERDGQSPDRTRIVRVGRVCELLAAVDEEIRNTPDPSPAHLPVESLRPLSSIQAATDAPARAGNPRPYRMSSSDFDVAFITPMQVLSPPARSGPGDLMERLLGDFGNWSRYVDAAPPVLLIRVTPKLVEGFWTKVARGAATTVGVSIPSITHLKANFTEMRALCGDAGVVPVHPFKLEHRVSEEDTLVEGLYAFDPDALTPGCGTVTLQLYSEEDPGNADALVVDPKVIEQVWKDFASWRDVTKSD